jgi:hypothetical protein
MSTVQRLLVSWSDLKKMGWPYSKTHTVRLMKAGRFPQCIKLESHRNSHPVWKYSDVIAHFRSRGLTIDEALPK